LKGGKFFFMEMVEKISPREVWRCGHDFIPHPAENLSLSPSLSLYVYILN
jgi:hypothetical protein